MEDEEEVVVELLDEELKVVELDVVELLVVLELDVVELLEPSMDVLEEDVVLDDVQDVEVE